MIRKKILIFLLVAFSGFPLFNLFSDATNVSTVRLKKIQRLVDSYAESGKDIRTASVKKNIYKDIAAFLTLSPDMKIDKRTVEDVTKEVRIAVEKNFPDDIRTLRKRVEAEAKAKFKMANLLDNVYVEYQRGTKYYTASGIFYNYGGNSIRIGDRIIAIFDLMPESRAMFDKEYCRFEKDRYISRRLNDYQQKKMEFSTNLTRKIREDIVKNNEDAGYIYILGSWKNPQEVADIYIKSAEVAYVGKKICSSKDPDSGDTEEAADKKSDASESPAVAASETSPEKAKTKAELQYDVLKKKIDKKREAIANSCAGVDADQGYKENIVTWGMPKEEVVLVLTKENETLSELPAAKDSMAGEEILKVTAPADGPIQDMELHFIHNLLYKAVVNFKIVSSSTMVRLGSILNERYGFTDEQKDQRKKQDKGEEFDDAEKAKQEPKTDDKKDKKGEKAPEIPIEQSYHWTGKITVATLYIKLKPDRSGYVDFKLIKESPRAKDEARALSIKEKQRKVDEQRAKEIDLSKKKVNF